MIAASAPTLVNEFKAKLKKHVDITDLGELHWLLGIEVWWDHPTQTLHLSQCSYLDAILQHFGFEDLKLVSIPMDTQVNLSVAQSPVSTADFAAMRSVPSREAVGSLMYLALTTQPNIAFAISVISQFMSNPGAEHWNSIRHVFRYLKGTRELWLTYGSVPGGESIKGYANADGSMAEDCHVISGYAFLLDGGTVSWSLKR